MLFVTDLIIKYLYFIVLLYSAYIFVKIIDDDVEDEENREELNELYREANMPIEEIILNYKKRILMARETMGNDDEPGSSTASPTSKPDPARMFNYYYNN